MTIRTSVASLLLCALLILPLSAQESMEQYGEGMSAPDTTINITRLVSDYNDQHADELTTSWSQGEVTPIPVDITVEPHEMGGEIEMPEHGPVPTPTWYDGKLYVSGGFGSQQFYCFDAATGQQIWGVELNDDGPSSAAVADGIVVFNTESCTIFALDAATGEHLWSWWLGDPLTSSPTISNGRVYTSYPYQSDDGEASHVMVCSDLQTGEPLWQKWIDSDVMSAPVADNGLILISTFAGTIYQFNPLTGDILSALSTRATSAPVMIDGDFYFTMRSDSASSVRESQAVLRSTSPTQTERVVTISANYLDKDVQKNAAYAQQALDLDAGNGFGDGAPMTANPSVAMDNVGQSNVASMQAFQGSRILNAHGKNYSTMGDRLICVDQVDGEELWSVPIAGSTDSVGGHLGTAPVAAGDEIILCTLEGKVIRISAETGEMISSYSVKGTIRAQPVVMEGTIFVPTVEGGIEMIRTAKTSLTGWSTWGGDMERTGKK